RLVHDGDHAHPAAGGMAGDAGHARGVQADPGGLFRAESLAGRAEVGHAIHGAPRTSEQGSAASIGDSPDPKRSTLARSIAEDDGSPPGLPSFIFFGERLSRYFEDAGGLLSMNAIRSATCSALNCRFGIRTCLYRANSSFAIGSPAFSI